MAKSHLKKKSDFEFALLTFIFRDILSITDLLFQILQSKSLNISYCQDRINDAVTRPNSLRNEEIFRTIFNTAKNLTSLSSKRGITSNENEIFTNYKILFYEILQIGISRFTKIKFFIFGGFVPIFRIQ
jgi:hypothetical protein